VLNEFELDDEKKGMHSEEILDDETKHMAVRAPRR
jgi:hypothetical protein